MVPIKVYTNNCRASLDVIVFHGIPPEKLHIARSYALPRQLGRFLATARRSDGGKAVRARGTSRPASASLSAA